jgi:uncharacterized protein YggU (UPF0235/DUF167 family)
LRITAEVKAGSREDSIEPLGEGRYLVKVREQPRKGKANVAVTKALKRYLGKPVRLVYGSTSTTKVFEVEDQP